MVGLWVLGSIGCAGSGEESKPAGEVVSIDYAQAETYVGKRVKLQGWILGGGNSFRTPGSPEFFYYVVVPDPQVDWNAIAEAQANAEEVVKRLSSQSGEEMSLEEGATYRRTLQVLDEYRALIQAQEEDPKAKIWGRLRRKMFGEAYGLMPDLPDSWEIKTRSELLKAYEALLYRFRLLMGSSEVELSGTLYRSSDKDSSGVPFPTTAQTKLLVLDVDTIKVLRTAKDIVEKGGAPASAPVGAKSQ
jgi:hypothetical protein